MPYGCRRPMLRRGHGRSARLTAENDRTGSAAARMSFATPRYIDHCAGGLIGGGGVERECSTACCDRMRRTSAMRHRDPQKSVAGDIQRYAGPRHRDCPMTAGFTAHQSAEVMMPCGNRAWDGSRAGQCAIDMLVMHMVMCAGAAYSTGDAYMIMVMRNDTCTTTCTCLSCIR